MPKFTSSTVLAAIAASTCTALIYSLNKQRKKKSCSGSRTSSSIISSSSSSPKSSSSSNKKIFLFVGDIGGTNTRLALYSTNDKNDSKPLYLKEYLNEKYITDSTQTFENAIFLQFLSECDLDWDSDTVLVACFAVAGPVRNNSCTMTNLGGKFTSDKKVDSARLEVKLDGNKVEASSHGLLKFVSRCKIVNDFVGQGYGLLDLDLDKEVVELTPGSKAMMDPYGPKACVGAGTGLGECFLTTSSLHPEEGYECYPSEGGHVDFVPRDNLQEKLLEYLREKFEQQYRVSVERVVSGKGLANVYEFLAKKFPMKVKQNVHKEFENAGALQGKVVGVSANSETESCGLCVQAMEIMMSAYGAEVGNCGVTFIPTGGLYVSGGLTPKNIKFIQGKDSPFMKAYKDKGRMSALLDNVPLFGVLVEDLGLRGARVCALRELNNMN